MLTPGYDQGILVQAYKLKSKLASLEGSPPVVILGWDQSHDLARS